MPPVVVVVPGRRGRPPQPLGAGVHQGGGRGEVGGLGATFALGIVPPVEPYTYDVCRVRGSIIVAWVVGGETWG